MIDLQLNNEMTFLLSQIRQLATTASSLTALQMGVAEAISKGLTYYSWTGFYMLDPTDSSILILGPFVGDPTPHVRILVTQGVYGAAVASEQTVIVDDVNADPRYLSCSIKTKSEIVVLICPRTFPQRFPIPDPVRCLFRQWESELMSEHTNLPAMAGLVRKHVAQHFHANGQGGAQPSL
jgi:putative methionine-R-sulfoxide reductase with GAF domain